MANNFRARLKQLVEAMFYPVPTRISPEPVIQAADEEPADAETPPADADLPANTQP